MKIDLHVHTSELSACASSTAEEMVRAGVARGLDAVCFTEHNRLWPTEALADLNERYAPFRVFGGVEISISGADHCLVLGRARPAELETRTWTYPDLHRFTRSRASFLVVSHPFRYADQIPLEIDEFPPDAIELRSVHVGADDEERIREVARRVGAQLVCNSDAHFAKQVGMYYNRIAGSPKDERELAGLLAAGERTPSARGGLEAPVAGTDGTVERNR